MVKNIGYILSPIDFIRPIDLIDMYDSLDVYPVAGPRGRAV